MDFLQNVNNLDLPEFAGSDIIDPASGKNNVIEAATEQKQYGWFPFRKRPERNVMNWLHRLTFRQLEWFKNTFIPEVDAAFFDHEGRIDTVEEEIYGTDKLMDRVGTLESDLNDPDTGLKAKVSTIEGQINDTPGGILNRLDLLEDITPVSIPLTVSNVYFSVEAHFTAEAYRQAGLVILHLPHITGAMTSEGSIRAAFDGGIPAILLALKLSSQNISFPVEVYSGSKNRTGRLTIVEASDYITIQFPSDIGDFGSNFFQGEVVGMREGVYIYRAYVEPIPPP